ncbi:alkane 1-monooxygenase [Falsigemmobacter faecalis]|uniref:Alkane 1-monooxygenase n=1 Tax=Falsigemmobacter faecalis TaxID=2488730 RepID=A0A3P3DWI7_9RHOB|nr:alkane 1-monooxygenase [Falsigemmobacter faecalis]
MSLFSAMTLLPVALLLFGAAYGGAAAVLALAFIAGMVAVLDRFAARAAPAVPEADEFPAAPALCVVLGGLHLLLLPWLIWRLSGPDPALGLGARVALFLGFALWLGQVSNSNAHELIHRNSRFLRALGVLLYSTIGYGHHASAHRLVHHRYVASERDPNTARRGEGFWRYLLRVWPAEYRAGRAAEAELRQGPVTPYRIYAGLTFATAALAFALAGGRGVLIWAGLAAYAQLQLLLSDYVQHYGLRRERLADGRLEAVGPQHSWDAAQWASSALMLNAPRHSDHHANPLRAYPGLTLPERGLRLPYSLPVMAALALVPRLWFRVMHPHLPR